MSTSDLNMSSFDEKMNKDIDYYNATMGSVASMMERLKERAGQVEEDARAALIDHRDWRRMLVLDMPKPQETIDMARFSTELIKRMTTNVIVNLAMIIEGNDDPEHVWICVGPDDMVVKRDEFEALEDFHREHSQ